MAWPSNRNLKVIFLKNLPIQTRPIIFIMPHLTVSGLCALFSDIPFFCFLTVFLLSARLASAACSESDCRYRGYASAPLYNFLGDFYGHSSIPLIQEGQMQLPAKVYVYLVLVNHLGGLSLIRPEKFQSLSWFPPDPAPLHWLILMNINSCQIGNMHWGKDIVVKLSWLRS